MLDSQLEREARELNRILTHELFHFAWVRLSNAGRYSYEALIRKEWSSNARGELGWSAESRKLRLGRNSWRARRRKQWSEYLCESFCDTAAWLLSGVRRHPEFTLAKRYCDRRAAWFEETFRAGKIPI